MLKILADRFDCEVRSGKCSEVSVYRAGGRIFTLGHYRSNDEVHSLTVKLLLSSTLAVF